jgi:predicted ABC-type ATPase
VPRLRVFAGPNGSGKSTIKSEISPHLISTYVNADDIEKDVRETGFLDLAPFNIVTTPEELRGFLLPHALINKAGLRDQIHLVNLVGQQVDFRHVEMNSYYSSVISDFIRHKLLDLRQSFTFETVMSSDDKVRFMKQAQDLGYRTYLYFVATDSVTININRVANRVDDGGHAVAEEKIVQRYERSLGLLPSAVAASNRAYIFDNSADKSILLAEITDGIELEYHCEEMPEWFVNAYVDQVTEPNGE